MTIVKNKHNKELKVITVHGISLTCMKGILHHFSIIKNYYDGKKLILANEIIKELFKLN